MLSGIRCLMLLIVCALAANTSAQTPKKDAKRDKNAPAEKSQSSVYLADRPSPEYLSGEANVAVSGNQNPIVKLGLSPNGATIIEFPASDKLFNIIPGNSNLVTVEESPTKETDRFVVVRPGDGFASPTTMAQARRAPATSVIVQMTSGMVITFLFYPVPQLSEQAHRVVVTYDRNEVIAARKAAGLAVNLDSNGEGKLRATASLRVASPAPAASGEEPQARAEASRTYPKMVADLAYVDTLQPPAKWDQKTKDPVRVAGLALTEATRHPESFKKWSDSVWGLSLSISPVRQVGKHSQIVVIAVRNTRNKDARILPEQPYLTVETADDKGRTLQIEDVKKIGVQTTVTDDVIPGGETRYYALVYETPILGARQRLRVAVGQTNAADEPATAVINR